MTHEFLPSPASENQTPQTSFELEAFASFDLWMDEQLELLVARWIHTAAPNSQRVALKRERATSQSL